MCCGVALRSTADWLEACDRLDIPAAPLHRLADLQEDPHLEQTGYFLTLQDPKMGPLVMPSAPLRFNGVTPTPTLPPHLGEHTVEVLRQVGLDAARINRLLETGAAIQNTMDEPGLNPV